jgi:hypothetical protein
VGLHDPGGYAESVSWGLRVKRFDYRNAALACLGWKMESLMGARPENK